MPSLITLKNHIRNLYQRLATGHGVLDDIRAEWGHEVRRDRDLKEVALYHGLRSSAEAGQHVDDTTWQDLDLDALFSRIDRNVSHTGSQYLYHLLHTYAADDLLVARRHQYTLWANQAGFREQVLLQLRRLRHRGARFIPNLIFHAAPERPRAYYLIYLMSFLSLLFPILSIFNPLFLFASVAVIVVNLLIGYFYGRRVAGYFADISSLSTMLTVGLRLGEMSESNIAQLNELQELRSFLLALNRKIGWLTIDESRLDDFSRTAVAYFNYFCLFNLVSFVRAISLIGRQQSQLGRVFELIGSLDATISIASYLESLPYYCSPQLETGSLIDTRDIYHPLLTDPVANSFRSDNASALITGSNMAGKTTFMKTIGLNIILGQTLGVCLAQEARLPQRVVRSSIRRSDDLNENKSYYFKEIEAILEFMKLGDARSGYVFLIDEIYRGTNTIERIAAAASALKYIARHNTCLVTTHDVELQKLLADDFAMYHFSEQIADGRHFFDYCIQAGPTSSRNAIRLLELKGYPPSVVAEANEIAARLTRNGSATR